MINILCCFISDWCGYG